MNSLKAKGNTYNFCGIPYYMLGKIVAGAVAAYLTFSSATAQARNHTVNSQVTTLAKVAEYVDLPVKEVRACNPRMSARKGQKVTKGEKVFLGSEYEVQSGDMYDAVRIKHGVSRSTFDAYNKHVPNKHLLQPGDVLYLPCTTIPQEKYRTVRFPSGLELRIVEKDSDLGKELRGSKKCNGYSWNNRKQRKKLVEQCQFYNPREGELLLIRKQDLERRVSENFKLKELVRANFPWLMPSKYIIQHAGETFFKYAYVDVDLVTKLQALRTKVNGQIPLERRTWTSVRNGDVLSCNTEALQGYQKKGGNKKVLQHCRKHGFRPYVYNIRMYREIDHDKPKRKSGHVSGDAVDIALNYCDIRREVEEIFKNHGVGRGDYITHVDVLNRRRWSYNGMTVAKCKKHDAAKKRKKRKKSRKKHVKKKQKRLRSTKR